MFERLQKIDPALNWINLGIIGTASLIPFPTSVLASALRSADTEDQRAAILLYAAIAALMSAAWLPAFAYLQRYPALLNPRLPSTTFAMQILRPAIGNCLYIVAALLGWWVHPYVAVTVFAYYAWTSRGISTPDPSP